MALTGLLDRKWRKWRYALLGLAALSAGGWGARAALFGPQVEVVQVVRHELLQTVVASGRVESPLRVDIGSQVSGAVASLPVAEGQTVRTGQHLIELDNAEALAAVAQARAAVAQAAARLQQLKEVSSPVAQQALLQATANLRNAQNQFERSNALFARGYVGQAVLDEARRSLSVAESQDRSARVLADGMAADGADVLLAQASLGQARAALRIAQVKLGYTIIAAPVDGVLITRNVERGDIVQPGKVLMVLSPQERTQLVAQIDEKNIALIHVGQPALASADAYPGGRFEARLAFINPAVDPQRGSVQVKFDVDQPPAYLRQDMTVSIELEVARRPDASVIPTEALHESAGGSPWVFKVVGRHLQRQPVVLGANGAGSTEVVAGLHPSDQVVANAGAGLREKMRVRAVPARAAPSRPN